ncbi:M67 family metallopeptidase [Leadbettera azotonutricia]|uniref:Mov34/MPN/PAD-1 n=1 Tax=Leadbettera azotonutricia (strain ATCC BAA-888 / DSM 13862 / ZAS-9) TaxID=545695 RepID=F5YCL4_LEAAZ|nr:M67 family metallopeptidase [Leadbettera azotonutricia]AEF81243.1 Mov34/MPN/PAD-1 [Leadbettera azotonutricia ZAS-9]
MLILPKAAQDQILAHARSGLPNEACGLLAGLAQGDEKTVLGVYCLKNLDQSPEHFSMAPEDQFKAIQEIRKKGWALLGNFHSHPSTPSRPSNEDIRLAFDPSLSYVIVSLATAEPVLKSFLISKGLAAEEAIGQ